MTVDSVNIGHRPTGPKLASSYTFFVLTALVALLLAACGPDNNAPIADTPAQDESEAPAPAAQRDAQSLVLVSSDTWWDGIHLPTQVMKVILEDDLGYNVEIINAGSVPEFLELVSTGAADAFVSAWFPTNDFAFDRFPNLVRIGRTYGGDARDAFEGWMASNALAQRFDVDGIEDLFDPAVIEALDTDGDGLGNLIGCPQAWACSQRHAEIMEDYGLNAIYEMDPIDDEAQMLSLINQRVNNSEPAVFYMYQPVAFPEEGTLDDYAVWIEGTEPYLPLAFSRSVTRSDFIATHPDVAHVLREFEVSGADVGAAMRQIAAQGNADSTLEQIARDWVEANRAEVDSWLPPEYTVSAETVWPADLPDDALVVAYSQDKEDLFLSLAIDYNLSREDGTPPVHPVPTEMADMMEDLTEGWYSAVSPDSSIWISQMDRMWAERNPDAAPLAGSIERYALTPVVIAMLEDRAADIGYPDEPVGWVDLMNIAQNDPGFRWSHPSASTATGLLSVTAEFYAATDKTTDLAVADVQDEDALATVTEIEATVNRYGAESEDRVITRNLAAGGRQLDAFVTQEQKVIFFNQNSPGTQLVAIYPEEGTFWMDHPLVLLDGPWVTDGQQRVFRDFARFVTADAQQQTVLQYGYRPADVGTTLEGENSLISAEQNVNPDEPRTLLQVPSPGVIEEIREAWLLTKRPASIVLVIDVSGSMEGEKLAGAKGALLSFVDQIESERDHVALVPFSSNATLVQPLAPLERDRMISSIRELNAGGGTMLYDAIAFALDHLDAEAEPGRARVVVAMTDGQSDGDISVIENRLAETDETTIIYTVGYGDDADMTVLQRIAQLGEGQVFPSDPETISQLYELLSEFF